MSSHSAHPRLLLLIRVAEDMFYMPRGSMVAQSRFAPTISFRQLAIHVALRKGFTRTAVAQAFSRDRATILAARRKAQETGARSLWWVDNADRLEQRWDEAVASRKAAEERVYG